MLRAAGPPPPLGHAAADRGSLHHGRDGAADPLAGTLSVQGNVARVGREGLFDDVVGRGFQLIVADRRPARRTSTPGHAPLLDTLDASVASLDPDAPHGVRDVDGRLTAWLAEHGAHAVLVRPDFYVFGSAASPQTASRHCSTTCEPSFTSPPHPPPQEPSHDRHRDSPDVPPRQPQDHSPAGDDRLLPHARRRRGRLPGSGRRVAVQRRREPPHRAARVPELRRRPREGHAHRDAPLARSSTGASRS